MSNVCFGKKTVDVLGKLGWILKIFQNIVDLIFNGNLLVLWIPCDLTGTITWLLVLLPVQTLWPCICTIHALAFFIYLKPDNGIQLHVYYTSQVPACSAILMPQTLQTPQRSLRGYTGISFSIPLFIPLFIPLAIHMFIRWHHIFLGPPPTVVLRFF